MGQEYKRKKMQNRPNSVCLACNGTLKDTTLQRAFYTCSSSCAYSLNKGISALGFSPNVEGRSSKRFSQNGYQLACAYFILKDAKESLSGLEVMERVRGSFGNKGFFKTSTFANMFSYYGDNVQRKKVGGRFEFFLVDKTVPFNEALKAKYGDYLFENKV